MPILLADAVVLFHVVCQTIFQTIKGVEAVATPSTLFYAENAAILPLWLGMIIWPEKPVTKAVMSSYATVIVAAFVYVWLTYEALQVHASDNMAY